jgi:DNA-binding MarR family transcriptional regulator
MSARERRQRWRDLTQLYASVASALDTALDTAYGLTANDYELLAALTTVDGGYLRMQRLSEVVALPQSTTSRLVARLEGAGLLERYLCSEDRRGIFTRITPAGRNTQAEAAATYDQVLRDHLDRPA